MTATIARLLFIPKRIGTRYGRPTPPAERADHWVVRAGGWMEPPRSKP